MKNKEIIFKEGDRIFLKAVKVKGFPAWEAGKYTVEKMAVGKMFRYVIAHKKRRGSFLFVNQKQTKRRARLLY